MEYLSNIELYYSNNYVDDLIIIRDEECKHIVNVMRHTINDELYVTDGLGRISQSEIVEINKKEVIVRIKNNYHYENLHANFTFCLPKLKSTDRFDFAIEKCVELGITNFVIYDSDRGIKKGDKVERWNKIGLAAMKQSLLSYLPVFTTVKSINELIKTDDEVIILEQNCDIKIEKYVFEKGKNYRFIFGPEGGLSEKENAILDKYLKLKIVKNRLRSETAIIATAVKINR